MGRYRIALSFRASEPGAVGDGSPSLSISVNVSVSWAVLALPVANFKHVLRHKSSPYEVTWLQLTHRHGRPTMDAPDCELLKSMGQSHCIDLPQLKTYATGRMSWGAS